MSETKSVGIIGLWHQGIVGAACLAECGYDVTATGADEATLEGLNRGQSPIYEPGLDALLQQGISSGRLRFTGSMEEAVRGRQDLILMVDTPVNEQDQSDLQGVYDTARRVAACMEHDTVMLVTAQVPVGTCETLGEIMHETRPDVHFGLAYSPENLRLGQAIDRFMHPRLPVFGANEEWTRERVLDLLSVLDAKWEQVDLKTAEMTKHALNAFLATSISFGNEMGNICDMTGADFQAVARVLRMEERVGPRAMLFPGLGFSGGTLARDMQTLRNLGDRFELETFLLDGVWQANRHQNEFVMRKLRAVFGDVGNLHIAVLGLTYKPGTSTLRRSASLEIIRDLAREGAMVWAHDPKADPAACEQFSEFDFYDDPYEAVIDASAVVIITGWPEYRELDFARIRNLMSDDVLIDCNNMLDPPRMMSLGFRYLDVGRGRG